MYILKRSVVLLLFSHLAEALQTKKQNQTISRVKPKINDFIEDDIGPQFNLNNKNSEDGSKLAHSQKENSSLDKFDLTKETKESVTPKHSEEKSANKAIQLPIDLLLRYPKISSPKNTDLSSKTERNVTKSNNSIVHYLKPKINFCEDAIEAIDESVADFYSAIKANNNTNKTLDDHDIKVVDNCVNINMSEPENSEVPAIDARNALPDSNSFRIISSPNVKTQRNFIDTPTTKIEILIKYDPSISDDALRLNSSIVIHNTTYQEITKPTFCSTSPRYTPQWSNRWYAGYPYHFYKCPYARSNDYYKFYTNNQYIPNTLSYTTPNTVWKAWSNIDLTMTNPNDRQLNYEEIGNTYTPEYANMYEIHDQNAM